LKDQEEQPAGSHSLKMIEGYIKEGVSTEYLDKIIDGIIPATMAPYLPAWGTMVFLNLAVFHQTKWFATVYPPLLSF